MKKVAKTYKVPEDIVNSVHDFCDKKRINYNFFVAQALEAKLAKEMNIAEKKEIFLSEQ